MQRSEKRFLGRAVLLLAGLTLVLPVTPVALAAPGSADATQITLGDATSGSEMPVRQRIPRNEKEKKKKDKKADKKGGKNGKGGDKNKEKPFEEVIKDFEVQEGLFNLYTKDDKTYLEIQPEQYDKIYMISLTRVGGIGQFFPLLGNQMMWEAPVQFKKVGKEVQLLYKNVYFRAPKSKEMTKAVNRSFSDSLFGSTNLESAPHPDKKSDLIDVSKLLIRDVQGVGIITQMALQSSYKADSKNSYLGRQKAFPNNVEIETIVHFMNPMPRAQMMTLMDSRSMFIRYNFSFSAIPEDDDFVPRFADDRVGHFSAPFGDYSTDARYSPFNRYVARWKLEKKDPLVEVSTVKEPITFYLDHSIPQQYRAAITEGILVWNDAFERIGLKDAMVVKDAPTDEDWDSSDVRYSTIRWFVTTGGNFAIGPSRVNPFTGQIYDADIGFSEGMVRFTRNEYREQINPLALFENAAREARQSAVQGWSPENMNPSPLRSINGGPVSQCNIGDEMTSHAAFGYDLMLARGVQPDSAEEKSYIRDFLVAVTAHEVGHTLGLRHNYRASTLHDVADLQNEAKTKEMGLTASVMDYTNVNIAPEGVKQGQYFQTTLGTYDYWAIEYAYAITGAESPEDELDELAKIASKAPDPTLPYSTDEDAMAFVAAPIGMDPRSHTWDLGKDPIAYYEDRVALSRELWGSLPGSVTRDGDGYQAVRRAFNKGLTEYFPAITSITKFVGGVKHNRYHVGDPNGSLPYVPVSAKDQRRALNWLNKNLFAADAFNFNAEVIRALAVERFGPMSGFILLPRLDYPVHDTVLAMQNLALARLYHPALLDRVLDMETKMGNGDENVDMAEIFGTLRDGIWSEVKPGSGASRVNTYRRSLQRLHLQYLVDFATRQISAAPAEATTLARYDLAQLQKWIGQALGATRGDAATQAHLTESQALIEKALEASFVRSAAAGGA